jgi:hypothetical protein
MLTQNFINSSNWLKGGLPGITKALCVAFVILASCQKTTEDSISTSQSSDAKKDKSQAATVSVFAKGFTNPRGLKFGPDGYLYVAEAGPGGTTSSVGLCAGLSADGVYFGSATGGGVSKVSATGVRTTVTHGLPTSAGEGILGVADVAFIGNTLYALINGGGCTHGVPDVPNGIVRINSNGSFNVVANLGAWQVSHPVTHPPADFEPEGTWYSMVAVRNELYAVDPNHGELVKVTTGGSISRVADFTINFGHVVPTSIAYHGNFYIGNLNVFPIVDGSSNIYKVNPGGNIKVDVSGLTTVLGVAFDDHATMYVLENTTGNMFPTPFTGRVVRINPNGSKEVIAWGLALPTGITYGPDGNLYVSNWGFGQGPGGGEVLKITLH